MAQRKQAVADRKKELAAQLADARQSISHGREALKSKLQVKKQLRRFALRKPKAIFASSVVTGLVLTLLLKRPKKSKKSSPKTTNQMLLSWGLTLVKPAAKAWLIARAKTMASERAATIRPSLLARQSAKNPSTEIEAGALDS